MVSPSFEVRLKNLFIRLQRYGLICYIAWGGVEKKDCYISLAF
ncbi:hypothetical protein HMPREF9445_01687 [Bacteroides clarus YIT 12056]|uniref:Uncharacterized protein n=1 Tax=Bacteroides clarus YIT 12056 TaxID=762984 RepID=A0ABN0CNX2_9BACE|nr:hypothetical protein HMPREF9445_01687 [Bacteroides clarus YIT 12056]